MVTIDLRQGALQYKVSDILAGDGKIANLFYSVITKIRQHKVVSLPCISFSIVNHQQGTRD